MARAGCKGFEGTGWAYVRGEPRDTVQPATPRKTIIVFTALCETNARIVFTASESVFGRCLTLQLEYCHSLLNCGSRGGLLLTDVTVYLFIPRLFPIRSPIQCQNPLI
jgi:hypothetical protein